MLGWQLFNSAQIFWYPNNHTSIVWLVQHDPSTLHEVWRHAHYIKLQLILQKFRLERYCGFLLKFWISCCTVLCVLPWHSMNICCLCRLRWIHKSVCNSRRCTAEIREVLKTGEAYLNHYWATGGLSLCCPVALCWPKKISNESLSRYSLPLHAIAEIRSFQVESEPWYICTLTIQYGFSHRWKHTTNPQ